MLASSYPSANVHLFLIVLAFYCFCLDTSLASLSTLLVCTSSLVSVMRMSPPSTIRNLTATARGTPSLHSSMAHFTLRARPSLRLSHSSIRRCSSPSYSAAINGLYQRVLLRKESRQRCVLYIARCEPGSCSLVVPPLSSPVSPRATPLPLC